MDSILLWDLTKIYLIRIRFDFSCPMSLSSFSLQYFVLRFEVTSVSGYATSYQWLVMCDMRYEIGRPPAAGKAESVFYWVACAWINWHAWTLVSCGTDNYCCGIQQISLDSTCLFMFRRHHYQVRFITIHFNQLYSVIKFYLLFTFIWYSLSLFSPCTYVPGIYLTVWVPLYIGCS